MNKFTYIRLGVIAIITVLVFTMIIGTLPGVLETYSYQDSMCYTLIDSEALTDACYIHCPYSNVNCARHISENCNNSCPCTCRLCMQKKGTLCGHDVCVSGSCPCSGTEKGCQCTPGNCRCAPVEPPYECPCESCDPEYCNCDDLGCTGEQCYCEGCKPVYQCPCESCDPDLCNCEANGCSGEQCACEGCIPGYLCPCESCDPETCNCEENGCTGEECVCEGCSVPLEPDPDPAPNPNPPPTVVKPPTGGGGTTSRDRDSGNNRDNSVSTGKVDQEPEQIIEPEAVPITEPIEPVQPSQEEPPASNSGSAQQATVEAMTQPDQEAEEQPEEPEEETRTIIVHETVSLANLAYVPSSDSQWTLTSSTSETFATAQAEEGEQEDSTVLSGNTVPVGGTAGIPVPILVCGGGAILLAGGVPLYQCVKRRKSLQNISKIL